MRKFVAHIISLLSLLVFRVVKSTSDEGNESHCGCNFDGSIIMLI